MIINPYITELVEKYKNVEVSSCIKCAHAILCDIVDEVETPPGTLEDAIAFLIVANGDY